MLEVAEWKLQNTYSFWFLESKKFPLSTTGPWALADRPVCKWWSKALQAQFCWFSKLCYAVIFCHFAKTRTWSVQFKGRVKPSWVQQEMSWQVQGVGENSGICLPVLGKQNSCGPGDRTSHYVGDCSLFPFSLSCSFYFALIVLFCLSRLSVMQTFCK